MSFEVFAKSCGTDASQIPSACFAGKSLALRRRDSNDSAVPTIFAALQSQLGLRLESRKGPVDLLVVDSVEKVPAGN